MIGYFPSSCRTVLKLLTILLATIAIQIKADDPPTSLPYDEAIEKDITAWSEFLVKGDYDALEKIGDELRTQNAKYRNGRGRLWRFTQLALAAKAHETKEAEFTESIKRLDAWLKAKPKSINARLVMAQLWLKYALKLRSDSTGQSDPAKAYADRNANAEKHLDEIATLTKQVDNTYRRLRIELTKGQGEKPDIQLVYDGLKDDPTNMELVHGMSVCLLPRWYGEEGELEKFADEVVRRTKDKCGELQYIIAAISTKELLKAYLLDTHQFSWPRLQQGFRDVERLYPNCDEFLNDEAQFAFMAGDLPALHKLVAKIGDRPRVASWNETEIKYEDLRKRINTEMLQGDQKQVMLGHVDALVAVETLNEGKIAVSVDWNFGIRMHETATGERRGWMWIRGIQADSISIHPVTALFAAGSEDSSGIMLQNLSSGKSGGLNPSEAKIMRTAFSPQGDLLAAADEQGLVVVYDLKSGMIKHEFATETKRQVTGLVFSGKASKLAAACESGDLLVFDLGAGKLGATHKITGQKVRSIAWSDPHVAAGTSAGEVHVLNGTTGASVSIWKTSPAMIVKSLAFSPDSEKLAIGLRANKWSTTVDTPLLLWNFSKEKDPKPLKGHKMGVNCVRFLDRGNKLISGSSDWTVRIWEIP